MPRMPTSTPFGPWLSPSKPPWPTPGSLPCSSKHRWPTPWEDPWQRHHPTNPRQITWGQGSLVPPGAKPSMSHSSSYWPRLLYSGPPGSIHVGNLNLMCLRQIQEFLTPKPPSWEGLMPGRLDRKKLTRREDRQEARPREAMSPLSTKKDRSPPLGKVGQNQRPSPHKEATTSTPFPRGRHERALRATPVTRRVTIPRAADTATM